MSFNGTVAAVVGKGLAASLGKKGTESDVTLYNHKQGDVILSFVEPSSYPEKIQSLASSLNIADQVLLKVDAVDKTLAEVIVALDAYGMKTGHIILGGGITPDAIQPLIKDTILACYSIIPEQVASLRETLAGRFLPSEGEPIVQVDHCFQVNGVGTVALGVVKEGVLRRHENLFIYPERTETMVKSIQVHDIDVPEASAGVRVGLALKDVKPDQVVRGSVLSPRGDIRTASVFDAEARLSRYAPSTLREGDCIMVNVGLTYTPAEVASGSVSPGESSRVRLELEKEIPVVGGRMLLLDPGQRMPRVFGCVERS